VPGLRQPHGPLDQDNSPVEPPDHTL
jgi:hypothetical protein